MNPPGGAAAAGSAPWQSVEACLQALPGILDPGGYARADAYAYLYGRLEVRIRPASAERCPCPAGRHVTRAITQ